VTSNLPGKRTIASTNRKPLQQKSFLLSGQNDSRCFDVAIQIPLSSQRIEKSHPGNYRDEN
jgi:hypothetical protein